MHDPRPGFQETRRRNALSGLEAEVAECLVGFCHAVNFVTLLHGTAAAFGGLEQFVGQALGHGLFATLAGGFLDPAHGQGQTTDGTHFHRNLVVGAADPAGLDFNQGLDVVDGNDESFQGILARILLLDQVERTVDCLLYTSPSPRDVEESRMPSSA